MGFGSSNTGAAKGPRMSHVKKVVVCAMCIALAFALNQVALFRMPLGGSVTPASMLFIVLAGYWLGPVWGIASGVAMGLLDMTMGAIGYHPLSYVLDYALGFGALGISGFFRTRKFGLQIGYIAGVLGRFVMVFLSGYLFFYMYAPAGQHAAVYSAIYNLTYIAPEMIATFIIISLPAMKHAIGAATKTIVAPGVYAKMAAANAGSVSVGARITTGAVIGALGGLAFVLAGYIRRLEEFAVTQFNTNFLVTDIRRLFGETLTAYCDILPLTDSRHLFNYGRRVSEYFTGYLTEAGEYIMGHTTVLDYTTRLHLLDTENNISRMLERNTEQIFALNTVGVIFLAIGAALLISVLAARETREPGPRAPEPHTPQEDKTGA